MLVKNINFVIDSLISMTEECDQYDCVKITYYI